MVMLQRDEKPESSDGGSKDERAWHAASVQEAISGQNSGPDGLSETEARARLQRYGPNRLAPPRRRGPVMRFLAQFHDVLIYVLLAAAAVTAALGHWIDTQVIVAVVVINAVIGFIQEGKAENALNAIRNMLAPKADVVRDGHRQALPGDQLVPGDIVLLEAGARVPADARLIDARNLRIDEAVLTGESVAAEKAVAPVGETAALGDRSSMAYSGTLVTYGQGKGLVVATAGHTAIGRISGMLSEVTTLQTPLTRQMAVFAKWLTGSILALAALVFAFGLLVRDYGFTEIFMAVVGLTVAAIPEGLPAILTITLAIGVQGMARRNAIVRRLPAIETLGSVSVICSDKTGTLTRNEMAVVSLATARRLFTVSGVGYAPQGGFSLDGREVALDDHPLLAEVARAALLCNDASLHEVDGHWTIEGDPMEGALLAVACKAGLDQEKETGFAPRTDLIPFDSAHRFMATLHHSHRGEGFIYVKGAPERILEMCARQRGLDGDAPLDQRYWQTQAEEIAASGQRLLAVAMKTTDPSQTVLEFEDVENGLTFLGLFGLIDPPREEAVAAVADCRAAGIQVKMITGDHAGTAAAIAGQLGLENPGSILTGRDIDLLDEETLKSRVTETSVFARTSPEHKLRLVMALQAQGAVVAMTGDGVNDAPALKRADVGIAMGRKGSEAAKEAAEMVLADDNFATIAQAVRAGRTVYDNLKKAILFILPTNGGEAFVLIAAILLGTTLPITAVQILWVNMVTAVTLALALAFEPAEPDIMRRPPRRPGEPILSGFLIWRVAFVSTLFLAVLFAMFALAQAQGADIAEARTVVVNTLVVLEIFYLFSVRYLKASSLSWRGLMGTPAVLIAVAAVTGLQILFTYLPFLAAVFDARPLSPVQGLQIVAAGILVLLVLEIEKWIRGRRQGHAADRPTA
ncbi:cation-transporting P-type ATPase [Pelagibius sp.]|uniref:cation-transporting P-type ATPase n=1 Tax=Pelagibius sp. TaxID=1931238 RepID=UPI00261AE54F|nr:cation-transporting P-type ATPase [Pelagibius sp.]